ncbi:MAG: aldose 1-epimerase [Sneathiella sp.]|nr:aldose 1-epimerase [Sneathiella sp.]
MGDLLIIKTSEAELQLTPDGGCICAYRLADGFDILRPANNVETINPLEASSFPLVPYSNRINDGVFEFRGNRHEIPLNFGNHPHSIHGVGWQSIWQKVSQTENKVTLELSYSGDGWPFEFVAHQTFTLEGASLRQEMKIRNMSDGPMPVGLGAHPYFQKHGEVFLTADAENVWMNNEECLPIERMKAPDAWVLKTGKNVDTLECDHLFEPWRGSAMIHWPKEKKSLTLSASNDLDRLVVYAPKGEEFFCVEPVSHITDAFNLSDKGMPPSESGMRILPEGESWSVWIQFDPV